MRKLFIGLSLAALPLLAQPVQAQSVDIDSSMGARCLTTDCSTIEFFLELAGNATVHKLDMYSHGGIWGFGSLVAVLDQTGKSIAVDWRSGSHPDQFSLWFNADSSPEPMRMIVDMVSAGAHSELGGGPLTFVGEGFNEAGHLASFRGTVVPEPGTLLLLLAALIPFAYLFWRRRRTLGEGLA